MSNFCVVTPWTVAHQAPLSMEFSRQKLLEWVAIPFSRGSSWPSDQLQASHIAGRFFTIWAMRSPWNFTKALLTFTFLTFSSRHFRFFLLCASELLPLPCIPYSKACIHFKVFVIVVLYFLKAKSTLISRALITKCHRLSGLKNRNLLSHGSEV